MQVDFYQLAGTPVEQVIASLAEKVLEADGRLLIVAEDEAFLARLDRMLWDQGADELPPARACRRRRRRAPADPALDQPDAPNQARNMLIADGNWREAALTYDRSFYLFDDSDAGGRAARLEAARRAGKASSAATGRRKAANGSSKA